MINYLENINIISGKYDLEIFTDERLKEELNISIGYFADNYEYENQEELDTSKLYILLEDGVNDGEVVLHIKDRAKNIIHSEVLTEWSREAV